MGDNSSMAKKSSLDFDFSDIAGKTTQVESIEAAKDVLQDAKPKDKKPEPAPEKPSKTTEKLTGFVVAIPMGEAKYLSKDLADCSPEEFLTWARAYYPHITAGPERFQSVGNKVKAFQQIVSWHQSMMPRTVREKMH